MPREDDPSTRRLGALLWLLAVGATGAAVAIAAIDAGGWAAQNATLATGAIVLGETLALSRVRREAHLVVALGGGLVLMAVGIMGQYDQATGAQYGAVLVAVGLGLMLFGWAGALASPGLAYLVGGGIAFVGTEMLSNAALHWPVVVGLATGVVVLAAFIAVRHRALLVVGLFDALVFLVQGIVLASARDEPGRRGSTGVILVAFAIGLALLAGALFAMRGGGRGRAGGEADHG